MAETHVLREECERVHRSLNGEMAEIRADVREIRRWQLAILGAIALNILVPILLKVI